MQMYNKIMLYFWLAISIFLFIAITYLGLTEGFKIWGYYYVTPALAFLMYLLRKWMMKRQEKHLAFLEEQKSKENR